MRTTCLLVQTASRYEKVKRRLESELRLVGERFPAIPAGGAERTGRIIEAIEDEGERLIGCSPKRLIVHGVSVRIIEFIIALDALAEAIDAFEVGLDVRAPLALYPGVPALLDADRCVHGEGRGAIRRRRIHIVAEGVTRDTGVVDLVEIVKFGSCQGLLFDGQGHFLLSGYTNVPGGA